MGLGVRLWVLEFDMSWFGAGLGTLVAGIQFEMEAPRLERVEHLKARAL